jgi:hypothetical protein
MLFRDLVWICRHVIHHDMRKGSPGCSTTAVVRPFGCRPNSVSRGPEVRIRKDPATGGVIPSARPSCRDDCFLQLDEIPAQQRAEFADFPLSLRHQKPLQPG